MAAESFTAHIEVEEMITSVVPANNGAGPLWCYGSPGIVRHGHLLYVSLLEPDLSLDRLCNSRWTIWQRDEAIWSKVLEGEHHDEREPCPLARLKGNKILLSVNPLIDRNSASRGGACNPHLLDLFSKCDSTTYTALMPISDKPSPQFSEHSYRGLGVDYDQNDLLLLNIDAHHGYAWSLTEGGEVFENHGFFSFPIRACYPQVGLKNGAAHILAIGDVIETNQDWKAFKKAKTGRDWDYDFRRLFYTWTPDIRTTPFSSAVEIASYEETAGYIRNFDLFVDIEGYVHLLYTTKNIWHESMREIYFQGLPIVNTLEYRVLKDGKPVQSHTLSTYIKDENMESDSSIFYTAAGFHIDKQGRIFVIYSGGGYVFIMQVSPWAGASPMKISLKKPLVNFLTTTARNGSDASEGIDLYGTILNSNEIHYARIRLI